MLAGAVSLNEVREILNNYQIAPRKRWGQNFLVDRNILTRIADVSEISAEDYVVEIGPGVGSLTGYLAPKCKGLLAIEIDHGLKPVLESLQNELPNMRILFADVLKIRLEESLQEAFGLEKPPFFKVCANIPYNITSPIIFKLLEECPRLQKATLMMQKEVALRAVAEPGSNDYGLLSISCAYYARLDYQMTVSRNCFYPRPEVDSSVINITPHQHKILLADENKFKEFIRFAFQHRRKTMLNICASFFKTDKTELQNRLTSLGIGPKQRPENLGLQDFARLVNYFVREG
ncbi:16S rRNA (adenine(1518)-N(6)/adenine(1519)-N(6))-dimethyltransferase RsmA [Syntrophomonas palmitatica]|uniref:16S rRNA (adenine(1518)-N(6)/adenine(1519)-N(6))- dimethyltransferase RsmA n=1 Tax=Syntrophomonas palmitatica TaxID=402877 RepID=UPI0006D10BA1|nr:16S rRNA (adenine(1518)-N(6)/adenine(1519)-N(6))-dimethyltransferase RsmA [Syntrophomonas palmitatica]